MYDHRGDEEEGGGTTLREDERVIKVEIRDTSEGLGIRVEWEGGEE